MKCSRENINGATESVVWFIGVFQKQLLRVYEDLEALHSIRKIMAFWGVEIKPGKPFTHKFDDSKGRLHISMATLGLGAATAKSVLQCNVGNRSPVYLCSLSSGMSESLQLNLEFEEVDEVIFSVIGQRSIHLCGFYLGSGRNTSMIEESESYGEDIANTETERSDCSDEDEYEDSFIDDDADPEAYPPSPVSDKEEASHDNKQKGSRRRLRRKYQRIESDDDKIFEDNIIVNCSKHDQATTSNDDDSLRISSLYKSKTTARILFQEMNVSDDKRGYASNNNSDDVGNIIKSNSKVENVNVNSQTHRDIELPGNVALPYAVTDPVKCRGMKRKKKEQSSKGSHFQGDSYFKDYKAARDEAESDNLILKFPEDKELDWQQHNGERGNNSTHDFPDANQSDDRKVKKRKKKNKSQGNVEVNSSDLPQSSVEQNIRVMKEDENIIADAKPSEVKTLSSGLVVLELEMGTEDGKIAASGRKISVYYTGKLKDSEEVFESNVGHAPFKFRLGKGQVIEGWDVGLEGMQMGGKRRLIIPPSMGFGSEGCSQKIPPDSWLVYDFELVRVH